MQKWTGNRPRVSASRLAASGLAIAMVMVCKPTCAVEPTATAGSTDLCRLLDKSEVGRALGAQIVRAEPPDTQLPGCDFSARGSAADQTGSHAASLAKSAADANGSHIDGPTEKLIESLGSLVAKGSDADTPATARHPGEVVVFGFYIQPGDASTQMRQDRQAYTGIAAAGVTSVADLGDEAFATGGAMLSVRKGKRLVQFTYPSCSCTTREIIPLARKVMAQL